MSIFGFQLVRKSHMAYLEQVRVERNFLADRYLIAWDWGRNGNIGLSSNAMVREALVGDPVDYWPYDQDDLDRCERTLLAAPSHLKPRMTTRLHWFRRFVALRQDGQYQTAEAYRENHP